MDTFATTILHAMREPLVVLGNTLRITHAAPAVRRTLRTTSRENTTPPFAVLGDGSRVEFPSGVHVLSGGRFM